MAPHHTSCRALYRAQRSLYSALAQLYRVSVPFRCASPRGYRDLVDARLHVEAEVGCFVSGVPQHDPLHCPLRRDRPLSGAASLHPGGRLPASRSTTGPRAI